MAPSVEDEHLFTGHSGRLLLVLSASWLTVQMGRQLLLPLLPAVIETLEITPFRAGLTLTVLWGVYGPTSIRAAYSRIDCPERQ